MDDARPGCHPTETEALPMPDANPYQSPAVPNNTSRRSTVRLWLVTIASLACSLTSLFLCGLYGHWHWYRQSWQNTLPARLGLSWSDTLALTSIVQMGLAILSMAIAIALFRRKHRLHGWICLPISIFAILALGVMT